MKLQVLLAFAMALLFSCAPEKNAIPLKNQAYINSNILGGRTATLNVQKRNGIVGIALVSEKTIDGQDKPVKSYSICSGALISKRFVVTAAHCLADPNLKKVFVTFGLDIEADSHSGNLVQASKQVFHEKYIDIDHLPKGGPQRTSFVLSQPTYDIGLLKLDKDAPADFLFAILPTPADSKRVKEPNSKVTITGYGSTVAITSGEPDTIAPQKSDGNILRFVTDVPIEQTLTDDKEIVVNQMNGTRGACHGDSGGPVFLENSNGTFSWVGITSRGTNPNGDCDRNNVITNVGGYIDWLKAKAEVLAN